MSGIALSSSPDSESMSSLMSLQDGVQQLGNGTLKGSDYARSETIHKDQEHEELKKKLEKMKEENARLLENEKASKATIESLKMKLAVLHKGVDGTKDCTSNIGQARPNRNKNNEVNAQCTVNDSELLQKQVVSRSEKTVKSKTKTPSSSNRLVFTQKLMDELVEMQNSFKSPKA